MVVSGEHTERDGLHHTEAPAHVDCSRLLIRAGDRCSGLPAVHIPSPCVRYPRARARRRGPYAGPARGLGLAGPWLENAEANEHAAGSPSPSRSRSYSSARDSDPLMARPALQQSAAAAGRCWAAQRRGGEPRQTYATVAAEARGSSSERIKKRCDVETRPNMGASVFVPASARASNARSAPAVDAPTSLLRAVCRG